MLKFDGYKSEPLTLTNGIDQGCPLSGIFYQFYNSDLIEICDTNKGEDAVTFMDNMLLLARGKTLLETNAKVKNMMIRLGGWTQMGSHSPK